MIAHAADGERLHVVFPRDAAEIGPESFADCRGEPRAPFRSGEYAMYEAGVEGVHFLSSLRDLIGWLDVYPAINGWAIFKDVAAEQMIVQVVMVHAAPRNA